jgi:hypothetical protein
MVKHNMNNQNNDDVTKRIRTERTERLRELRHDIDDREAGGAVYFSSDVDMGAF